MWRIGKHARMRIVRHIGNLPKDLQGAAVAIGNFDGLHIGHLGVLNLMRARADALKTTKAVLTFEPHPRSYFDRENAPGRLMRISDKFRALRDLGVEIVYVLRFNKALAELPAEQFIHQVLSQSLNIRDVTTGDNFAFGKGKLGNVGLLRAGAEFSGKYTANAVPPVEAGRQPVSSSRVRALLAEGNIAGIEVLYGRPYTLNGRVVHGDQRARTLGYPTANIVPPPYLALPAYGVYIVEVTREGQSEVMRGIANIGVKPTFGGMGRPMIEVHLLDRSLGLYGEKLTVHLLTRLRAEKTFENVAQLAAQIARDAVSARQWFYKRDNPDDV